MLLFLKAFKVVCAAGCNRSAPKCQTQWRWQQTAGESVAADHRPLWWFCFRLSRTGSPGRRHPIKGQRYASPVDDGRLIWHKQNKWLGTSLVDKQLGMWDGGRERDGVGAGTVASSKSILSNIGFCGYSSLSTIVLLVAAELIKAHLPTAHKTPLSPERTGIRQRGFF